MGDSGYGVVSGPEREPWAGSFLRALVLHGRPEVRHTWYLLWARRFAAGLRPKLPHLATREDAESFLAKVSSAP